jgi:hypothetical protein
VTNGNGWGTRQTRPIFGYYFPRRTVWKNHENHFEQDWSPGRDQKKCLSEYEAGVLVIKPTRPNAPECCKNKHPLHSSELLTKIILHSFMSYLPASIYPYIDWHLIQCFRHLPNPHHRFDYKTTYHTHLLSLLPHHTYSCYYCYRSLLPTPHAWSSNHGSQKIFFGPKINFRYSTHDDFPWLISDVQCMVSTKVTRANQSVTATNSNSCLFI